MGIGKHWNIMNARYNKFTKECELIIVSAMFTEEKWFRKKGTSICMDARYGKRKVIIAAKKQEFIIAHVVSIQYKSLRRCKTSRYICRSNTIRTATTRI